MMNIMTPPKAKSGQGKLSAKAPFHFFLLFQGNVQNRTRLKGPTFEFFCYFATECMFINQKGSLCDIFWHIVTFFEEIQKLQVFFYFSPT